MRGYEPEHRVPISGDASYTTATKRWAALGGYGVWVPSWNRNAEVIEAREEKNYSGAVIGQTRGSTRQELTAWTLVLSLLIRSKYATDSASMLAKAKNTHRNSKSQRRVGSPGQEGPNKKPVQETMGAPKRRGPLAKQAWKAVLKRGAANQDPRKVKGHATNEDVEAGISTAADKTGNDKHDTNADEGVEKIKGRGLTVL